MVAVPASPLHWLLLSGMKDLPPPQVVANLRELCLSLCFLYFGGFLGSSGLPLYSSNVNAYSSHFFVVW